MGTVWELDFYSRPIVDQELEAMKAELQAGKDPEKLPPGQTPH